MKRLALVALLALVAAPQALAKGGVEAIEVCGAAGCATTSFLKGIYGLPGEGAERVLAPPVEPFVEVRLTMHGLTDYMTLWYLPRSGLLATGHATWTEWRRLSFAAQKLDQAIAAAAERVEPFPEPRILAARIDGNPVARPAALEAVFHAITPGKASPDDPRLVPVSVIWSAANPWEDTKVGWVRGTQLWQRGENVYLVEAASGPASAGGGQGIPWLPVVGTLVLLASLGLILRRRRRLAVALTAVALVLVAAAPANGKELTRAVVCGAEGCNTITDRDELRTLIIHGDRTVPPPAPGPFYSVELGTRDDVQDYTWTIWYAPAAKAIAVVNENNNIVWHPAGAAGFDRASSELAPFPRPRLTKVRIGGRVITEGAASYLRLFTQPARGAVGDPGLSDWVEVDLLSARPTPWTVGRAEFSFSAEGRLLERSWQLVALPESIADAIAAGEPLPTVGAGRREVPSLVLAAGLVLLAAVALLLRRRRRLALAVAGAALAMVLAAPAHAKFPIELRLSDATPRVGQQIRVAVSIPARYAAGADMRLVAVPPGMGMYDAIEAERRHGVALTRRGATWRGVVRFRRPGRWLLVVPNWGAPGYALPPPVIRKVRVGA